MARYSGYRSDSPASTRRAALTRTLCSTPSRRAAIIRHFKVMASLERVRPENRHIYRNLKSDIAWMQRARPRCSRSKSRSKSRSQRTRR